jgi:ABC-type nitrate/sulfonate/bicarbonate transport system substrate-binding protein
MYRLDYGIPTDKIEAELRFGIAKGFFRAEDIDLSLQVVFGGPEIAAMYDSGALKIGGIGSPPATTALANGARFKIIGSGVRRHALQYLVVNSSISSWTDFRGKSVGVLSYGSCSYWFGRFVLQRNEIDPDHDVNLIGLGERYRNVVDLVETNELQGAVISELNVSIGEYRGAFRIMKALTEPEYCPTMQWMVTVANNKMIEKEPSLVAAVLRAARRSYRYAAEHQEEFAQFCADYYGVDATTMLRAIDREANNLHYDCEVDVAGLQLTIDLQRRLGAFEVPMAAADIVDLRFAPTTGASAIADIH